MMAAVPEFVVHERQSVPLDIRLSNQPYKIRIPDNALLVHPHAFEHCLGLVAVTIPSTVNLLGASCFAGCSKLSVVRLPSLSVIGTEAFKDCGSLVAVDIPQSVYTIGKWAFCGCVGLTAITIPSSVSQVGAGAFINCEWLIQVTLSEPARITWKESRNTFKGCHRLRHVVAAGRVVDLPLRKHLETHTEYGASRVALVANSPAARWEATKLRHWSLHTHRLCSLPRREWVAAVMMVAARYCQSRLHVPTELWLTILEWVPRAHLGTVASLQKDYATQL